MKNKAENHKTEQMPNNNEQKTKSLFTISKITTVPKDEIVGQITLNIPLTTQEAFELFYFLMKNEKETFDVTFKKSQLGLFDNEDGKDVKVDSKVENDSGKTEKPPLTQKTDLKIIQPTAPDRSI